MSWNRVYGRLYQGSRPPMDLYHPFPMDVLVLMAREYQPRSLHFQGAIVVHAPINDDPWNGPTLRERVIIQRAANDVAIALGAGQKVLVTCHAGLNRSGVVSALALLKLYSKMSPDQAIQLVRRARGDHALSNPHFERLIREADRHTSRFAEYDV